MAVYMIKVAMEAEEGEKTFKLRDIAQVENGTVRWIATREECCSKNDVSVLNEEIAHDIVKVMNILSSQPSSQPSAQICNIVHGVNINKNQTDANVWGYLTEPMFYHVGDVAAVVFAIQRWALALCTGFAVYQVNNTGGRIGCYFTDHSFGMTSDRTCYNLYNNEDHSLDSSLFVKESQQMWLDWLETERGRYYVDQLFDIPKTQVIIKQAERFFNNERNKESIRKKLGTELKSGVLSGRVQSE